MPPSALPWGLRMRTWAVNLVRPGKLDFESIGCDDKGNRYLLSEAHVALLQVGPSGMAEWLPLPDTLIRQARASGMLLHFNQGFEGIAIDPAGDSLWLAAEQRRRGRSSVNLGPAERDSADALQLGGQVGGDRATGTDAEDVDAWEGGLPSARYLGVMAEAAEICAKHGVKLFLEHKNSEPAMKILMQNIGMTLFTIQKVNALGVDTTNLQVNMDWQHLIMNGENLAEYADLLASEYKLGHQL